MSALPKMPVHVGRTLGYAENALAGCVSRLRELAEISGAASGTAAISVRPGDHRAVMAAVAAAIQAEAVLVAAALRHVAAVRDELAKRSVQPR